MILPREKLQIGFGFLGLFLVGFGIALVQPGARGLEPETPRLSQGVGFWKDYNVDLTTRRRIGPWLIGGGIAAIGLAYVIRQR